MIEKCTEFFKVVELHLHVRPYTINPYPPHGRPSEIPSGRGEILKVKSLEAKYEAKPEFPRGRGVQNKNPSVGGMWIFSETAHSEESVWFNYLKLTVHSSSTLPN